jgi:hypothetical protein
MSDSAVIALDIGILLRLSVNMSARSGSNALKLGQKMRRGPRQLPEAQGRPRARAAIVVHSTLCAAYLWRPLLGFVTPHHVGARVPPGCHEERGWESARGSSLNPKHKLENIRIVDGRLDLVTTRVDCAKLQYSVTFPSVTSASMFDTSFTDWKDMEGYGRA